MTHDDDITIRLSAYLDDELSARDRADVETRLDASESLRQQLEQLRRLREWAADFPGRQPRSDPWPSIRATLNHNLEPGEDPSVFAAAMQPSPGYRDALRRWTRRFRRSGDRWSEGLKRGGVVLLAGVALAGMGRSFYLEQRAARSEEKTRLQDEQLIEFAAVSNWSQTATALREYDGQRFSFSCPPRGRASAVWGSGMYTDDSSICTAAVHAGLISFASGGLVTIEIRPGQDTYEGTAQHEVETHDYGSYQGSFVFVPDRGGLSSDVFPQVIGWNATAMDLRGWNGSRVSYLCPPGGDAYAVWGSESYTDDSSICTAGVHAGFISPARGGQVTIEITPGQSEYRGVERYGIDSRSFGEWEGSFQFVDGRDGASVLELLNPGGQQGRQPAVQPPGQLGVQPPRQPGERPQGHVEWISWSTDAEHLRDQAGNVATFGCPAGGEPATVWGGGEERSGGVYTDDSSICTAAVHAGLIGFDEGGLVTIEIQPGRAEYTGGHRNGVQSRDYGSWHASFVFVP